MPPVVVSFIHINEFKVWINVRNVPPVLTPQVFLMFFLFIYFIVNAIIVIKTIKVN